ncbi:ranBP-type and C3HC4-type zinc finger-containing protein 1-like [Ischnura elegans]|uniref:ranBP-type and C3HC4-type zinc finger-containing protein 1-like n=1 Tax=Ischnura elegans TaxID=197161 RepID=UPI001ED89A29|nr:ranBP-type and C3HC4-type zinc finger-containing protein 1-like [Ischnura elegans]XP_046386827.1 ranBP-type and C3HC4-type zinc finger-containing protein 1-like [Ischnura elegans]
MEFDIPIQGIREPKMASDEEVEYDREVQEDEVVLDNENQQKNSAGMEGDTEEDAEAKAVGNERLVTDGPIIELDRSGREENAMEEVEVLGNEILVTDRPIIELTEENAVEDEEVLGNESLEADGAIAELDKLKVADGEIVPELEGASVEETAGEAQDERRKRGIEDGILMKGKEERRTDLDKENEAGVQLAVDSENDAGKQQEYEQLLYLEELEVVPNSVDITCPVCFVDVVANEGVTLRNCLHSFCCQCLVSTIQYSEEAEVKCPYRDDNYACDSILQDREIRSLVPEEVKEQLLARSVSLAEKRMGAEAIHCKTPDCQGWCVVDGNINEFPCPVCNRTNCLSCKSIHDGISCWQYQQRINGNPENDQGLLTEDVLNDMLVRQIAMYCPSCMAVIMKDLGCDWIQCTFCKLEICWVTRGPRWGPLGRGDNTGGCKCNFNGRKCHPACRNCH